MEVFPTLHFFSFLVLFQNSPTYFLFEKICSKTVQREESCSNVATVFEQADRARAMSGQNCSVHADYNPRSEWRLVQRKRMVNNSMYHKNVLQFNTRYAFYPAVLEIQIGFHSLCRIFWKAGKRVGVVHHKLENFGKGDIQRNPRGLCE